MKNCHKGLDELFRSTCRQFRRLTDARHMYTALNVKKNESSNLFSSLSHSSFLSQYTNSAAIISPSVCRLHGCCSVKSCNQRFRFSHSWHCDQKLEPECLESPPQWNASFQQSREPNQRGDVAIRVPCQCGSSWRDQRSGSGSAGPSAAGRCATCLLWHQHLADKRNKTKWVRYEWNVSFRVLFANRTCCLNTKMAHFSFKIMALWFNGSWFCALGSDSTASFSQNSSLSTVWKHRGGNVFFRLTVPFCASEQ